MAFFKPSVAKEVIHIDADVQGNTTQAVSTPCEVVGCIATAGGSAVAIRIYDNANAAQNPLDRKILMGANTGESSSFTPCQPMPFHKGVYVVFEQGGVAPGGGVGGGEISLVINR
jgi:hypothetical protein